MVSQGVDVVLEGTFRVTTFMVFPNLFLIVDTLNLFCSQPRGVFSPLMCKYCNCSWNLARFLFFPPLLSSPVLTLDYRSFTANVAD